MKITMPALIFFVFLVAVAYESFSSVANDFGKKVPSLTKIFEEEKVASPPPEEVGYIWKRIPLSWGSLKLPDALAFAFFTESKYKGMAIYAPPYWGAIPSGE